MSINTSTGNTLLESGFFAPCRAATTGANITLAGLQTIDAVALAAGDRVLVKDQTDATTNGIYAASTGNWVRTTDAASNTQFFDGMAVVVALGTVNAGQTFICTCADDPVVIGTSLLTFASQSAVQTAMTTATSTSSLAIGTGAKTFATQSGKNFSANQWLLAYSQSNPANQLFGQIASYAGGALVLNVTAVGGSGTVNDWALTLANGPGAVGRQPPVGTGNVTGPGSAAAGHLATFADTTGKVLGDGGVAGALANLSSLTPQYLATAAVAFGAGMLNGTIVASESANALTIAIKTLAGNTPSASDPVYFLFRDSDPTKGDFLVRQVTAALSVTIASGATLGFSNGVAGRIWLTALDNAGIVELAVVNCLNGTSVFGLAGWDIATTTNLTSSSNSAAVVYSATARAAVAMTVLGYLTWENGLTAAGTWASAPSRIQLYRAGIPLPGMPAQPTQRNQTGAKATGTTTVPLDDTIPQNTEGDQYMTQAITPTSAANLLRIEHVGNYGSSAGAQGIVSLFQDSNANALATVFGPWSNNENENVLRHVMQAKTTVSTTFAIRAGSNAAGTTTFNGAGGNRTFGGVMASSLEVTEIMA